MPKARRSTQSRMDSGELPSLAVPVTVKEFWKAFWSRTDLEAVPVWPLTRHAVRERQVLVLRLAWTLAEAKGKAENLKLGPESAHLLAEATDAFMAVVFVLLRDLERQSGSEEVLLSDEQAARLPLPPYLVCEAAARFVMARSGGDRRNERLDPTMAEWFESVNDGGSESAALWARLAAHAERLQDLVRRHGPETPEDEEAWSKDVLSQLRTQSDAISEAVAKIARSMEGAVVPAPRDSGRRKDAALSPVPDVEAYLWRQCGASTNEIQLLVQRRPKGESGGPREIDARQVARAVSTAKEALTQPRARAASRTLRRA